jgi:hypothetical protein
MFKILSNLLRKPGKSFDRFEKWLSLLPQIDCIDAMHTGTELFQLAYLCTPRILSCIAVAVRQLDFLILIECCGLEDAVRKSAVHATRHMHAICRTPVQLIYSSSTM